ncbi:MAG: UDP-N-acetylmuramoyl-L-alanyl-D-glutamate--2,6-diaminopimelate ligase [Clostridiales bacterium]|nr:UDP-N-acetylmuramoyl-L-alanyl-D-glutamate--2,6-diaminopimelate ligase [Clostridiales bacterium]
MQLTKLLIGLDYTACGAPMDADISFPATDSRSVRPGGLFICLRGTVKDGHRYAREAILRGAVACICDTYLSGIPCILVKDTRQAAAVIWNNFYGNPGRALRLVGITGTNGKTSTLTFLSEILAAAGMQTGTIGTLGYRLGGRQIFWEGAENPDIPASMTTPDPRYLYGMLDYMKQNGAQTVVMEVSSHSLAQRKTAPLYFDTGIFTNLSAEHLDYHKDMESYFQAKASLFDNCKTSIVNGDDPYGRRIRGIHVGLYMAKNRRIRPEGVAYQMQYRGRTLPIRSRVAGAFTVYNTMLSAIAALEMGISIGDVIRGIAGVTGISGRMERIVRSTDAGFDVYIDYAHTPEALRAALEGLRQMVPRGGRLTVIFGCGGDRDKSKRPIMGRLAGELCDRVIVTSDNARTEDKNAIIQDILAGMQTRPADAVIPDRREAIIYAVETAMPGDTILLAGKGHENYETGPDGKKPFSERDIVFETVNRLKNG